MQSTTTVFLDPVLVLILYLIITEVYGKFSNVLLAPINFGAFNGIRTKASATFDSCLIMCTYILEVMDIFRLILDR